MDIPVHPVECVPYLRRIMHSSSYGREQELHCTELYEATQALGSIHATRAIEAWCLLPDGFNESGAWTYGNVVAEDTKNLVPESPLVQKVCFISKPSCIHLLGSSLRTAFSDSSGPLFGSASLRSGNRALRSTDPQA